MKRFMRMLLILLLAGAGAVSWYFYDLYKNMEETAKAIYEPLPDVSSASDTTSPSPPPQIQASSAEPKEQKEEVQPENKAVSILLFGVDKRGTDAGRSDTIIYLVSNPTLKQTLMFSIPRDTRTQLSDVGRQDKINHAYAFGGMSATVRTVESFLGIPIDYYVKVDMEGFLNIIDSLGGVQVDNARAFSYEGYHFGKGKISLDGKMALAYARMRHDDPEGDLGRNKRQQLIVEQLMTKAKEISTVNKLDKVLADIGASVKTNLTFEDMKNLMFHYKSALDQVNVLRISGQGQMINGIYYYVVSAEERARIKKQIEEVLHGQSQHS
ncbi:LCP family protein [Brevibacillus choshinensis]|uniref:LCP family protein n=1 Tax=Brevibacillus choshinensis TaxID=54911 RepID=A0ABX7FLS2_BRECH|nr:LCP family protein [Brevibacillus choshinensis]QRG66246.1 LCP family protein [Brevibacillus choshinensis]